MFARARCAVLLALTGASCVGQPNPPSVLEGGNGSSSGTSISGSGQVATEGTTVSTGPIGTTGTASADTTAGSLDDHCADYPDVSGLEVCDLWAQCCPSDAKCMPWANDGSGSWNSTRCSPLDDDPDPPGSECTVEGSAVSGIDTCELGAVCWEVDPETNLGICRALCQGDPSEPVCTEGFFCQQISDEIDWFLCLPLCDPLLQDCSAGEACYPIGDAFECASDASGAMGVQGDPCRYLNACDPGLFCIDAGAVPSCMGSIGCCTAVCNIDEPETPCPAGSECTPFYEPGAGPAGLEHVGVCSIPS